MKAYRDYLLRGTVALLLVAMTASFGWSSTADVRVAQASTDAAKPPQHCIMSGDGSGQAVQCFESEAEALRVASGGRIQLAPGQTARSLPYEEVFGSSGDPDNPNSIQAILYEHANYGGATLTIYNSGCYIWNNMPGGWNDVTSSVWSGSCGVTLYDYPNKDLSGKWVCIGAPGTSYVGDAMNDRASSWSIP